MTPRVSIHGASHRPHRMQAWPSLVVSTAGLAWAATYTDLWDRFERRLKEIGAQDDDTIMNTTRWGDKPYRWDVL